MYALAILLSLVSSIRILLELIELADLDRELATSTRDATDSSSIQHAERKSRLAPALALESQIRATLGVASAGPSTDSFRAHALGLDSDVYTGSEQPDLIVLPSRFRGGVGAQDSPVVRCGAICLLS